MAPFEHVLLTSSNCFLLCGDIQVTRVLTMIRNIPSNSTFHCILYLESDICKGEFLLGEEKEINVLIY
jgi:hypothetical protein